MKNFLSAMTLLLVCAAAVAAQGTCVRYLETGAGFSFCPPDAWTIQEQAGEKYKVMFGTGANFKPNINIKEQTSAGTLAEYAELAKKLIVSKENREKLGATTLVALDQSEFITTSGLSGIKVTYQTEFKGYLIRSLQYYFELKGGIKIIVTGTSLVADKETLDPLLDRSLKTFRIEN
ncbi:MAG: hypothetical protein QOD75_1703 [Blastocatellia bacterium]|jgi:hypothetical protein|nr:hypothetical protein [Blastocatellia bacterium]